MSGSCVVVVGTDPDTAPAESWPYLRCSNTPAEPLLSTTGTDFNFPMCAEHRKLFAKTSKENV